MFRAPATCENCGDTVFGAGLVSGSDVKEIHVRNSRIGPCAKCGGRLRIADGVFSYIDGRTTFLRGLDGTEEERAVFDQLYKAAQSSEIQATVANCVAVIDQLYGFFLDTSDGFRAVHRDIVAQQNGRSAETGESLADLDDTHVYIGFGAPGAPDNVIYHSTTWGERKARNSRGGLNDVLLARYLIVLLYTIWEKKLRPRIAQALDIPESAVTVPVFGDLRRLRHDILHHDGIVREETASKLSVILYNPGGGIALGEGDVDGLVRATKAGLDELVEKHTGVDPQHRTIWRLQ